MGATTAVTVFASWCGARHLGYGATAQGRVLVAVCLWRKGLGVEGDAVVTQHILLQFTMPQLFHRG